MGTPVFSMDLKSQGEAFLRVLQNNKSKILWEFRQLLPDQPHIVVVKEQKREVEMDVTFKKQLRSRLDCVLIVKNEKQTWFV